MSFINKIPRGLRILIVMAVLGVLIWRFALNTGYYWYSIGAAVLLIFGAIVLVYQPFKSSKTKAAKPAKEAALNTGETPPVESRLRPMSEEIAPASDSQPAKIKKAGSGSFINKIPRGLRVLIVIAVLGVLIWFFAVDTSYFWYSIGVAVLLTFGAIVLVYKPFSKTKSTSADNKAARPKDYLEVELDKIDVETDYTDTPAILRNGKSQPFGTDEAKSEALQFKNAVKPATGKRTSSLSKKVLADLEGDSLETVTDNPAVDSAAPPVPLVEDETTLTDDDKNQLVNAVWYRCENPYCKYTSFLGVHHIIDEKEGGTNRLDNLIVLCPYCHDLAHRNEIPEKELRDWISNRENRFKSKPNWKYF